ncbi:MAG: hypothetical protein QNL62_14360 [Gammaproteobacteria bacterium]|nr:hypothetical protein [Gammaproteobacteria bacterium]
MTDKIILLLIFFLLFPFALSAQLEHKTDNSTGLKSWKFIQSGLELAFVQRLPDQTRGFFQGRGFSRQQADEIATQCVFQTIAKNTHLKNTAEAVTVSLKSWRVKVNDRIQGIKLKEDWDKQWAAIQDDSLQVAKPARIAFRWATFPSEQTFEPGGDYNWGMISFGLPPGAFFDLHVFWQAGHQSYDKWINNIQCPMDL